MNGLRRFIGKRLIPFSALLVITALTITFVSASEWRIPVLADNDMRASLLSTSVSDIELASMPEGSGSYFNTKNTKSIATISYIVRVNVDGQTLSLVTEGETIAQLLSRSGIVLGPEDEIDIFPATFTLPGMTVKITRVKTITESRDETIPFETTIINNGFMDFGAVKVLAKGADGKKKVTYDVVLRDGVESSRTVTSEKILEPSVTAVEERGMGGTFNAPDGTIVKFKKRVDVIATAYTTEGKKWKLTYSETIARVGAIAVDPKLIPLGSKMYIVSADGKSWVYGYAVAEDIGGSIKGNRIDLFYNTYVECINFGVRKARVYLVD